MVIFPQQTNATNWISKYFSVYTPLRLVWKCCSLQDDLNDGISTVSHDEKSKEVSSPKRMRSESDDETSTVSDEDIFSSSDEGESPEKMNDSDEEADPWGVLIHEAAAELRTKHNELVQSFENKGFNEINAKKQAFSEILLELRKELGNIYLVRLQWMSEMKRDPVHGKKMKTKDAFVHEDEFDPDEALAAAVRKRKFLLERVLEDRETACLPTSSGKQQIHCRRRQVH